MKGPARKKKQNGLSLRAYLSLGAVAGGASIIYLVWLNGGFEPGLAKSLSRTFYGVMVYWGGFYFRSGLMTGEHFIGVAGFALCVLAIAARLREQGGRSASLVTAVMLLTGGYGYLMLRMHGEGAQMYAGQTWRPILEATYQNPEPIFHAFWDSDDFSGIPMVTVVGVILMVLAVPAVVGCFLAAGFTGALVWAVRRNYTVEALIRYCSFSMMLHLPVYFLYSVLFMAPVALRSLKGWH